MFLMSSFPPKRKQIKANTTLLFVQYKKDLATGWTFISVEQIGTKDTCNKSQVLTGKFKKQKCPLLQLR